MTRAPPVHVLLADPHTLCSGDAGSDACLDADDRAHVARFRFERDRTVATASRILQRQAIVHAAGMRDIGAADLRFTRDGNGRPAIAEPKTLSGLCFSVANTHGLVGCAVAGGKAVGLDVECLRPQIAPELIERCCSARERQALDALPEAERARYFFELWTLKESYLKARGVGLGLEPARIGFERDTAGRIRMHVAHDVDADPDRWQFTRLPAGPRHAAALCVLANGNGRERFRLAWASGQRGNCRCCRRHSAARLAHTAGNCRWHQARTATIRSACWASSVKVWLARGKYPLSSLPRSSGNDS